MIEQVKSRKRNWHTIYRLVLRKDETLEEVASYRLTLLNIYILLSSIVIVVMGLMVVVIFFTPLKRLVPGFAEPAQHPDYVKLSKKMAALESEMESYRLYYQHFNQMTRLPDSFEIPKTSYPQTPSNPKQGIVDAAEQPPVSGEPKHTPGAIQMSSQPPSASLLKLADFRYLMPPISGVVSSRFDAESGHYGVDVLAPHDTPVKAIWDGHVITADWTLETGYTIGIQHSNDMVSFYKHNATLLKRSGAFVRAGEAIAIIGNTGKMTSGPHLHFELWLSGKPVDPTNYIDF